MPDELLDIVDDNDLLVDQQLRSAVHELGLQHRGVHVFLFTLEGKMLIQKRSADRIHFPSALDCSVSEHVKSGESYFNAAIRGMKEELGLTILEIKPIVKFKMNYGINDNEISTLYEGVVDPEKVSFDLDEIEQITYLSADEIHEMMMDANINFCGWFVDLMKWYWGDPAKLTVLKAY
ncbi:MAG TPA: NUDIX domain-containing protein [Anaerolineales bacterium]|nr:NUDIX domain-containing protein [Anaerolineales bacterium]